MIRPPNSAGLETCESLAERALEMESARQVRAMMRDFVLAPTARENR